MSASTAPTTFAPERGGAPVGVLHAPSIDCEAQIAEIRTWSGDHGVALDRLALHGAAPLDQPLQLLIALGGDGTILRALRMAAPVGVPVLGVNFGNVGFLADTQGDRLTEALAAVAAGHARIEKHPSLRAVAVHGPELDEVVYNDVVLGRRAGHGSARIVVAVDGTRVVDIVGDGVVVASGLGSTAYTVSAGGPAVSPRLAAIVLTPVAANTGPLRSLVVSIDEPLRLLARDDSAPLTVEIDGQTMVELEPGAHLDVRRDDRPALLLRTKPDTFYDDLRDRLLTR